MNLLDLNMNLEKSHTWSILKIIKLTTYHQILLLFKIYYQNN